MYSLRMTMPLVLVLAAVAAPVAVPAQAQREVLSGAVYVADPVLPEMLQYAVGGWRMRAELGLARLDGTDLPRGAVIRAFATNRSSTPIDITGVLLDNIDIAQHIVPIHSERGGVITAGYLLNDNSRTSELVRDQLNASGRPAWFQVRPNPIPPGGIAEVTVRLQRPPQASSVSLQLTSGSWTSEVKRINKTDVPGLRLASVAFNDGITSINLYLRRDDGQDFTVSRVEFDGVAASLPVSQQLKSSRGFLPLTLPLSPAWEHGTYHSIQVVTTDSAAAQTVLRARDDFFALGMWGYRNHGNSLAERARDTCEAYRDHLFNTHMLMAGEHSGYLVGSDEGMSLLKEMGLRVMSRDATKQDIRNPWTYARFLMDEPDAQDYFATDLSPADLRLGSFGQGLVEQQRKWIKADPRTLCLLNINNTYVPDNYLTYGAIPDILALDPYYIENLRGVYERHPERMSQHYTPMYVLATTEFARAAAEPRPVHVILNSTAYRFPDKEPFRYPSPEEKRIEFYMALGSGASGISYWWFTPYGECYGAGSGEPEAVSMMKELARLNAEARSVLDLLASGCPAAAPGSLNDPFTVTKPYYVLARTLMVGQDAAVITLINRDHASDRVGTVVAPVEKTTLTFQMPPWLKPAAVFRVDGGNFTPVEHKADGNVLTMTIGELKLADMIVVTSDAGMRERALGRWNAMRPALLKVGALGQGGQ